MHIFKYITNRYYLKDNSSSRPLTFEKSFPEIQLLSWKEVRNGIEFSFSHSLNFGFKLIAQINRAEDPNRFRLIFLFFHKIDTDQSLYFGQFYNTYLSPKDEDLARYWIDPVESPGVTMMGVLTTSSLTQVSMFFRRILILVKNYFDKEYKKMLRAAEEKMPAYKDVEEL